MILGLLISAISISVTRRVKKNTLTPTNTPFLDEVSFFFCVVLLLLYLKPVIQFSILFQRTGLDQLIIIVIYPSGVLVRGKGQ